MKKNLLFTAFAAATMLLATSCQEEQVLDVNAGEEAVVSFNIGTPQIATRAFSDGTTATQLQYAVYDEQGNILPDLTVTDGTINIRQTVNLKLTTGNKYTVVFWAAEPNAPYAVDFAAKTMTVDYAAAKTIANDEKRDAFLNDTTFTVSGNMAMDVHLRRPFAQLNIGTSDYAASVSAGYTVTQTEVEVPAYSQMNIITGDVIGATTTVTYNMADIPADTETFPVSGYKYLSMNYLLMAKDKETVDVTFNYTDGSAEKTRTFGSVPVQRNYRTNIYGQLLTSNVDVTVEIIPEYEDDNLEAWDGTTLNEPTFDAATNTYYISHAAELAYIAQLVNGTLDTDNVEVTRAAVAANSLEGKTVKLECDINLNGKEWTPIGSAVATAFAGSFDGNGFAINNMKITTATNSCAALFGVVRGSGSFSNVTINNAEVLCNVTSGETNFYGAGLVAQVYGSHNFEGITVKESKIQGSGKTGAILGLNGDCAQEFHNCYVKNCVIESTNPEDGGNIGGMIGFLQSVGGGNENREFVIANCTVEGTTINAYNPTNNGKRANGKLLGSFKGDDGWTISFTNCNISNTTLNQPAEVTYASPYGSELIGGCRADDGKGTVVIDGNEVKYRRMSTSQLAFEALIANGGEVKLAEDVQIVSTVVVAEGTTLTIDLNGKTITGDVHKSVGAVLKNEGELTIKGGVISSTAANGGSAIANHGTLVVENATLNGAQREGESWPAYPINNYGDMTLSNTTINGYQGVIACNTAGTTVVDNCTMVKHNMNTSSHVFYINHADAHVIVNSGTYTHNGFDGSLAYVNKGAITINGGTFSAANGGYGIAPLSAGTVTINGGTFENGLLDWGGKIAIYGGNFKNKPKDNHIAAGFKAEAKDGRYVIVVDPSQKIENANIVAETGAAITVDANVTNDELATIVIPTDEGDLEQKGLYIAHSTITGEVGIDSDKAMTIFLDTVTFDCNVAMDVTNYPTIIAQGCDFIVPDGGKICVADGGQLMLKDCKINGVAATAAQIAALCDGITVSGF